MRNRHLLLIFSAVAALSLSACDDDDHDATTDANTDSDGSASDAGPGKDGGAGDAGDGGSNEDGGAGDAGVDGGDADGGDAGSDGAVFATCEIACANFSDCSEACSQNLAELCLGACQESQAAALNLLENCGEAITALDLAAQCAFHVDLGETCDANHLCTDPAECVDGHCRQYVGLNQNCDDDHLCSNGYCFSGICHPYAEVGGDCDAHQLCGEGLGCHLGICKTLVSAKGSCDADHICAGLLRCIEGLCKRPAGYLYGECSSSDECIEGICQKDIHGNGPYCLLNIGDNTNSAEACVSYAYRDYGLCAMPIGGACSQDEDCDRSASCEGGTCKHTLASYKIYCNDSSECPTGASCQMNKYGDGPYCFIDDGQATPHYSDCASLDSYNDNGTEKCKYITGGDCSSNANLCAGICDNGTCKKLGYRGGSCSDNDECATGASCQRPIYYQGTWCFFNAGHETADKNDCASGSTYEENGVTKCRALPGSDCSQNPQICPGACEDGICKKLGAFSGACSSNDECPTGASCQKDYHGNGPWCLLDGGQETTDEEREDDYRCASHSVYEESGITKCTYLTGGDCTQNSCAGVCEGGTCKRLGTDNGICSHNAECATGASCQMTIYNQGPWCLLNGGQATEDADKCASYAVYNDNGTDKCTSLLGGDCNSDPSLCAGRCEGGTCKRLGRYSGYCSSNDECAAGASCQKDISGNGPYCLLDGGLATTDSDLCASRNAYNDNGTDKCTIFLGGDCNSDSSRCAGRCEGGTCKRLGRYSGYCSSNDECAAGASCQMDKYDDGPYCFLDSGEESTDDCNCAFDEIYNDNGTYRCSYRTGEDCTQNAESCAGVCENGICKLSVNGFCSDSSECQTGASCQSDEYDDGLHCRLADGVLTDDYNYCASKMTHLVNGLLVCGSAE